MSRPGLIIAAGLLVLIAAAYGRAMGFGFVWDDQQLIVHNPLVNGRAPATQIWSTHFFEGAQPHNSGLYRPVVIASFRLNRALSPAPWGFHLSNLLLHAACVLLVLWLGRRLGAGWPAAGLGAVLFAVYPPGIEAVAWISGRTDLLLGLGLGLSLAALPAVHQRASAKQTALVLGGVALALGSKEQAFLATALLGVWLLAPGPYARRRRWLALGLGCLLAGALAARFLALGALAPARPVELTAGGCLARLGTQLQLLVGFQLSAMVSTPAAGAERLAAQVLGLVLPLLGGAGAVLLWRRGARLGALLAAGAVLLLLPAALVRVPALRYLYTPVMLLCPLGALALQRLGERWRPLPARALAVALVLTYLGFGQLWLGAWRSGALLFATEAAHQPHNPDALFLHGEQLLLRGRSDQAARVMRRVLRLAPGHRPAWLGLTRALLAARRPQQAEQVIRASLRGRPRLAAQFTLLGQALLQQDKHQQALAAFGQALRRAPRWPAALRGAARCRRALEAKQGRRKIHKE